ncbi:hypothetical protein L207DRAFT_80389 [Hyaloscypha variabilis F]|uniref:Myb-like domain-containing protein n=1 Tax=Hyaloscypha variabilis (strain UAMH 11265 / GT02V1 / F) TaxID=1149755 RepID=A0A2J6RGS0_HYAVF|nr:hypothetical protein L207DRAFT_80389 [Hyaloscypha variabilis F]
MAILGSFPSKSYVRRPEWSFQHIPIAPKVLSLDTRSGLSNRAEDINALTSHPTLAPNHALGSVLSPEPKLERSDSYHVQLSMSTPQYTMPQQSPFALIRPSSGAWNPQDDQTLVAARAQGMNWAPIQQTYFPSKTPNACRKRHERLIERRNTDDWDGVKLEILAKNYMGMRREIWSGLAAQVGEKWNVVEQKCMLQGLKNLQIAARSCARRERMLDTSQDGPYQGAYKRDDSGLGLGDDLEADYDGDRAHDRSGSASAYQGHYYSSSGGSGGSRGNHPHGQRLPSMDMGIDAIINRPGNGH